MKTLFSLITAIVFPVLVMAQTNVDRAAAMLDSLATVRMNDLKMSPNLKFRRGQGRPGAKRFQRFTMANVENC